MRLALGRIATAAILLLAGQAGVAAAQPGSKVPRIGYISPGTPSNQSRVARLEAFRQGLREQGYMDGRNIVIDVRWAQGSYDRYAELAAELVRLKVDVLVTVGATGSQAAKRATKTIPSS